MDPFTMSALFSAIDTVTSGALSGAAGEMGRRSAEGLAGLVRRAVRRGDSTADDGMDPALPTSENGRRELAALLYEHACTEPDFAREITAWLRETAWLGRFVVPPEARCPQTLPPANTTFTDRDSIRNQLAGLLDSAAENAGTPTVVVLVGPVGMGKSTAAVQLAHELKERFPDGQLYVDLDGTSAAEALSPSDVLVHFLDQLGVPADRVPPVLWRQTALYRDRMADRRMIVILDDAHSPAQLRPLLAAAPGSLVLITSRHRLDELAADPGALHIPVGPLTADDSVLMLSRIVGPDRIAGHEQSALAVARICGGSPLALSSTGSRIAVREHLTWETAELQLADRQRHGRDEETTDMGEHGTDLSYQELRPEPARLYRLLGAWPGPTLTVGAAARAADIDEDTARALLEELADVHLLQEVAEERYHFHDLVRRHAERRAQEEDGHAGIAAAIRRMITWHLGFAAAAEFRVIPSRWRLGAAYLRLTLPGERDPEDGRAALAELRRERANLVAAVRAAEEYGFDELVWQLCEAMWGLHLRLGFHEQWVETHLKGVDAARRCTAEFGDPRAEGRMLTQLAFAYLGLGRLDDAEQALAEAAAADQRAQHRRGQATAVESLGLLRLKQWQYTEAERCFTSARRILLTIGPGEDGEQDVPRASALLEHHIGRALRGQERFDEAVRQLYEALARFRGLAERDLYNEGRVYMSLGETQLDAGDPAAARVCLDKALGVMAKEGAELQRADAAELRGRCARQLGDPVSEAEDLRTAAELYERAGDHTAAARMRARLAELDERGNR